MGGENNKCTVINVKKNVKLKTRRGGDLNQIQRRR